MNLCIVETRMGNLVTLDWETPAAPNMRFGLVPYYSGQYIAIFKYIPMIQEPFPAPANWIIG